MKSHNRQPCHDLPQTCRVSKAVCKIWICPIENFLTHPRTSLRINSYQFSKCNKHKSKINKTRLVRSTWRRFYIKQSNKSVWTSMNTRSTPSPWYSTNLQREIIRMSSFNTVYRQFLNTPKDKFQDQWTLILLTQTDRSKINDSGMKTKTRKNNTSQWNVLRKRTLRDNLLKTPWYLSTW